MEVYNWPDVKFWQEVAHKDPSSTFFHSPLWLEIIQKSFDRYRIATIGFVFDNNTKAVLPMIETKKGLLFWKKKRLKSTIFGGYGGIISDKDLSEKQFNLIYEYLKGLKASISIEGNPFKNNNIPSYFKQKKNFTQVLTLDEEKGIYKRLSRGAKSNINQAIKKGISIRIAASFEDFSSYYKIYEETLRRWGKKAFSYYPKEFIFNLLNSDTELVKLWVAERDQKIIAGCIIFYWNKIMFYWHGASLKQYFSLYPNNLLHWEIIKDGLNKGYKVYDFGPSGGMEGVIQFKRSFGSVKKEFISAHWKYRWER